MNETTNHSTSHLGAHDNEPEEPHSLSDDSPKMVEEGVMMKHLQKALAKIDHLEAEVHCLKTQINEKDGHRPSDSRGWDDEVLSNHVASYTPHERLINRHGIDPSSNRNASLSIKDISTSKPLRKKNRKQDHQFLLKNDNNNDSKASNIRTATFRNEKDAEVSNNQTASFFDEKNEKVSKNKTVSFFDEKNHARLIPTHHDDENGEDDLLVIDNSPASYGEFSSIIAKENGESGLHNLKFLRLELDQLKMIHLQSIEELKKEHAKLCEEQAMTSEEVRSLVASKKEDHQPRDSVKMRMTMFGRAPSALLDTGLVTSLTEDTFSLMMTSRVFTKGWILGCFSFGFQMTLGIMIADGQWNLEGSTRSLVIPFKVESTSFRVAQFLSLVLSLSTQCDILTSIRTFFLLGKGSNWSEIIGEEDRHPSSGLWIVRVWLPNTLKLTQGLVVAFVSFVIIVENKDTIQLLKDFTSLMVISEFDNVLFHLAAYGYLGEDLRLETERIVEMKVTTATNSIVRRQNSIIQRHKRKDVIFVHLAFLTILSAKFIGWGLVFYYQRTGFFFNKAFPGCGQEHYKLAYDEFDNGICYGGPFNTLPCHYEDGDCSNFNTQYPNCNGNDLTALHNVEEEVGNNSCNMTFAIPQCEYDGGDCCPYNIHLSPSFGDGNCDGGLFLTEGCQYDNKDCEAFVHLYPNCSIEELSLQETSIHTKLGNGICEGVGYNVEECGFEFGDCDRAQIGQDVVLKGVLSPTSGKIDFHMRMTGDGSKILVDMLGTNKAGKYDSNSNGTMVGYFYNSTTSHWIYAEAMGKERNGGEEFALDINDNGSAVALAMPFSDMLKGRVEIFNFFDPLPIQIFTGSRENAVFGYRLDMSDDGLRIAISSPWYESNLGMIQVFGTNSLEQETWMQLGDNIYGKLKEYIGRANLHLNSLDGRRVFFNAGDKIVRVYQLNVTSQKWIQLGNDINQSNAIGITVSADGNRFALSYHKQSDSPGEIKIFEWNPILSSSEGTWKQEGPTILSKEDGFGRSMSMNADGTLLATSTVNPSCDGLNQYDNASIRLCSSGTLQLYYHNPKNPPHRPFSKLPMKSRSIMVEEKQVRDEIIFGLEVSLSRDGSILAVSGYNIDQGFGFVKVYNVSDLFYMHCVVEYPDTIGDGSCNILEPYYTESCGFDDGDCPPSSRSEKYEDCIVVYPSFLGNGFCYEDGSLPYNSKQCGFDGGDCPRPLSVEGYPNCFVSYPDKIADGNCQDSLPYNSHDCGFDGGDCLPLEFRPSSSPFE